MEPTDLTTRVLIEIRDEIKATRVDLSSRIDETNARLDETNRRLDGTNQRLERLEERVTHMDLRLSSDILALAGAINAEVIHGHRGLRKRIEKCERDIEELKRKRRS